VNKYIENISKKYNTTINDVVLELHKISKPLFDACNYSDTTGFNDCSFLSMLILEYKPKNIMEIGTWVGTTSYAMALTSKDATIYTCDNNNKFVNLNIEQNNRIINHPNTHSTVFLNNMVNNNIKFDMIFNDASLSEEDCKLICNLSNDEFIFVTHDYYNSNGGYEKGHDAIEKMKKTLSNNKVSYTEYIPQKEWYFEDRINGCSALLICKK
jgi:predicted O-methyltransferase YrrM